MTDIVDAELLDEEPTRALVVASQGRLVTSAPVAQVLASFHAYQQLCDELLDKTDYQRIGPKDFRKKSGWRKLAFAFDVTTKLVERRYDRDDRGRIIRADVVVRATARNGRQMDGLGVCDRYERCCKPGCEKRHNHCPGQVDEFCHGWTHFSTPEHDIPSTAMTRATNRAQSDLFGQGEVSAEEMNERDDDGGDRASSSSNRSTRSQGQRRQSGKPTQKTSDQSKDHMPTRWRNDVTKRLGHAGVTDAAAVKAVIQSATGRTGVLSEVHPDEAEKVMKAVVAIEGKTFGVERDGSDWKVVKLS